MGRVHGVHLARFLGDRFGFQVASEINRFMFSKAEEVFKNNSPSLEGVDPYREGEVNIINSAFKVPLNPEKKAYGPCRYFISQHGCDGKYLGSDTFNAPGQKPFGPWNRFLSRVHGKAIRGRVGTYESIVKKSEGIVERLIGEVPVILLPWREDIIEAWFGGPVCFVGETEPWVSQSLRDGSYEHRQAVSTCVAEDLRSEAYALRADAVVVGMNPRDRGCLYGFLTGDYGFVNVSTKKGAESSV